MFEIDRHHYTPNVSSPIKNRTTKVLVVEQTIVVDETTKT